MNKFDVIVIGSGSAGLAAAYPLAKNGRSVAVVEKDQYLGGECPNYACVPTKTLLKVAEVYRFGKHVEDYGLTGSIQFDYRQIKAYKDSIVSQTGGRNLTAEKLAHDNIALIKGEATFTDTHVLKVMGQNYQADQFIVATGSSVNLPSLEGLEKIPFLTSKDAIDLVELPESIVILGAGPVGVEFATIFASFGSDVTLVQRGQRILNRAEPEVSKLIAASLQQLGVEVRTGFEAESIIGDSENVILTGTTKTGAAKVSGAKLLVATGTKPNLSGLGLDLLGVKTNKSGIETDENLRSSVPYLWAVGDVTGHLLYTHTAHYEGTVAAHNILSENKIAVDLRVVPRGVFCYPEVASVGLTEEALASNGRQIVTGQAKIEVLGRSLADQAPDGLVKVVADQVSGKILGATVVSPRAGEMIHELALAMKGELTVELVANMIHAYPTYSEAIAVAASNAAAKLTR